MEYQQACAAILKHTPGPWAAYNKFGEVALTDWRIFERSTTPGVEIGVAVVSGNWPAATAEANARLIAAAPELLGALSELLDFAIDTNSHLPRKGERMEVVMAFRRNPGEIDVFKKARAAIAKATAE